MITNFEKHTSELTDDELELIPLLINGFNSHKINNPITAPQIVKQMNEYLKARSSKIKMNEPRLRKCVNHIRCNSLLPLIATSKGYFVSTDKAVIESQIKSLFERASSIKNCADGLGAFIV